MLKNNMRCFISINLPEECKKEVIKLQNKLKEKNLFIGKYTEKDNLHLTLKFLGEISEEKMKIVENKLDKVRFEDFELRFEKLGFFSPHLIGIVWISALGEGLFDLQKNIDLKLSDLFPREERFMGHLTIARVKDTQDKMLFMKELKAMKLNKIGMKMDKFYLMKSELTNAGPKYKILRVYEAGYP
ncbi:MAG: RNA 2',3'-cyclic phosphodiesterase [Nanoarchaeota archaeon]